MLDDLAVQLGHAVDRMAGRHAEVGHLDEAVADDGHAAHLFPVSTGGLHHLGAEAVVDFPDNLINPGQPLAEEILRPAFQCLGHHRVIGVRHRTANQPPGILPGITAFIQQNTHKFGDRQGGVGIVDMNGGAVRQVIQGAELGQMPPHDVLDRGGNQEILLGQPQGFSLPVVVGGIQHLGDHLRHGLLLHGPHIFPLIE